MAFSKLFQLLLLWLLSIVLFIILMFVVLIVLGSLALFGFGMILLLHLIFSNTLLDILVAIPILLLLLVLFLALSAPFSAFIPISYLYLYEGYDISEVVDKTIKLIKDNLYTIVYEVVRLDILSILYYIAVSVVSIVLFFLLFLITQWIMKFLSFFLIPYLQGKLALLLFLALAIITIVPFVLFAYILLSLTVRLLLSTIPTYFFYKLFIYLYKKYRDVTA